MFPKDGNHFKFLRSTLFLQKYPHTNTREEFYQKVEAIDGRFLNPDKLS